ncbi:MAG: hypothetical protein D4R64_07190 [Porphyromonadaceae bacterium]|nr:MAG: hypothetical protein D4R64_07190 [Porphyromonadaceae bacterium]
MLASSVKATQAASVPAESVIARERIVDLIAKMDGDGKLTWDAPALQGSASGEWTVIRFGHTFTGRKNHPAPATGMGPECDKLSKEGIEANYNGMIGKLVRDVGSLAGKTFTATHVDSWDVRQTVSDLVARRRWTLLVVEVHGFGSACKWPAGCRG